MNEKGQMIGQGNTAEIYDWGEDCILKLYRDGLPDFLCQSEYDKSLAAYKAIKIVPKPVKIIRIDGRVGAVYEKLNGRTMLKEMMSKPWLSGKYARQLALCHVEIQIPVEYDLPSVKEKLKFDIDKTDLLNVTEKQCLYEYMDCLPDGNMLCHFDFHPDNIMISDEHYRIIDWMTACKGDKLSDVARTSVMLNFSQIPRVPAIVNYVLSIFQKYVFRIYIKEYLKITNETLEDIKKWELPVAAARLCEWIPEKEKQQLLIFVKQNLKRN